MYASTLAQLRQLKQERLRDTGSSHAATLTEEIKTIEQVVLLELDLDGLQGVVALDAREEGVPDLLGGWEV